MPADVEAPSLGDLALGYQPKLGVREGMEGHPAHPEEPRAQAALDLEAKWALGAGHPAFALDPQLPIDATEVPRAMLDPSRRSNALKVQAGVCFGRGRGDLKHRVSIVINDKKVIFSHSENRSHKISFTTL